MDGSIGIINNQSCPAKLMKHREGEDVMGIDTIIDYGDGIHRDRNICDDEKVFFGNGQGCSTIYFKTVDEARKFIDEKGYLTGFDSGLCDNCKCHFSYGSKEWEKATDYACRDWKKKIKKEVSHV